MARTYRLALPARYDGATAAPLIFNLHGSGSNKEQQALYSDLENQGTARGYVVVTADGTGARRGWNMFRTPDGADDYRFVEDLFGRLDSSLCLDPDRVYSTGISNGSAFSGFLACVSPFRLAAIAMVAATVPGGNCPPGVRVSAMAFHGTADPVVPYGGGAVAAEAAKGNAAPSAESTMSFWADLDGCDATPVEDRPWPHVKRLTFGNCRDGTEVVFYGIEGGGHTWPGSPVDLSALGINALGPGSNEANATALMLDFFDRHRRAGRPIAS